AAAVQGSRGGYGFLLRRSLGYLRPYWRPTALLFATLAFEMAFWMVYPIAVQSLVDNATTDRDYGRLVRTLAGLVVAYVLMTGAVTVQAGLGARVAARLLTDLRFRLLDRLQLMPSDFFGRA